MPEQESREPEERHRATKTVKVRPTTLRNIRLLAAEWGVFNWQAIDRAVTEALDRLRGGS